MVISYYPPRARIGTQFDLDRHSRYTNQPSQLVQQPTKNKTNMRPMGKCANPSLGKSNLRTKQVGSFHSKTSSQVGNFNKTLHIAQGSTFQGLIRALNKINENQRCNAISSGQNSFVSPLQVTASSEDPPDSGKYSHKPFAIRFGHTPHEQNGTRCFATSSSKSNQGW